MKRIENAESKRKWLRDAKAAFAKKYNSYKDPLSEIMIYGYKRSHSSDWILAHDRFLIVSVHELGFGNWDQIRKKIIRSP